MAELSEEEFRELIHHVREGHTEIVLEAVDRDRGLLARANQYGRRLLHRAAHWGRADLVGELLDRGADIHARTNGGWDALMCACYSDDADLAMVTPPLGQRRQPPCSQQQCLVRFALCSSLWRYGQMSAAALERRRSDGGECQWLHRVGRPLDTQSPDTSRFL